MSVNVARMLQLRAALNSANQVDVDNHKFSVMNNYPQQCVAVHNGFWVDPYACLELTDGGTTGQVWRLIHYLPSPPIPPLQPTTTQISKLEASQHYDAIVQTKVGRYARYQHAKKVSFQRPLKCECNFAHRYPIDSTVSSNVPGPSITSMSSANEVHYSQLDLCTRICRNFEFGVIRSNTQHWQCNSVFQFVSGKHSKCEHRIVY